MKKWLYSIVCLLLIFSLVAAPALAQSTRALNIPAADLAEHVPGELLIRFYPGLDSARRADKIAAMGLALKREIPAIGVHLVKLPPGLTVEQALARFSRMPGVDLVEPNYILHIALDAPVEVVDQWGLNKIRVPQAWNLLGAGEKNEVLIATVDSGVDKTRSDISSRIWASPGEIADNGIDDDGNGYVDDTWGWDFVNKDNDPTDDNMHGTAVTSVMVSVQDGAGIAGVCPWCKVLPVKVINNQGSGTLDVVASGIIYAADNGARVINLSVGAPSGTQTLKDAVNYASDAGVVVVAAAGNSGDNAILYPAGYANTIPVASTGALDKHSCFSNYSENYISVAAPGESIYVIDINNAETGYGTYSGTSLATPFVSGLAGLILGKDPSLTNLQVRSIIENSAVDLGSPGVDAVFGHGRIDAYRALVGDFSQVIPPDSFSSSDETATGFPHARKLVRDSNGTLHVVWHTYEGSLYRIRYATSSDDGVTWNIQPDIFSSPYESYHPALAADASYLYAAVPSRPGFGLPYQILFTRKSMAGGAWSQAEAVISGDYNAIRPDLFVDPSNGRLHVLASSFDDAPYLHYRSSDDQGSTWGTPRQFNPSNKPSNKTSYAAIYANGDNLYVVTRTVEPIILSIAYLNIWTTRSINGGQTWIDQTQIAADLPILTGSNTGISLAGIGNRVYMGYVVGFNLYFRRNDGAGWSDFLTLETADADNFYNWPSITQAEDGQAWIIFEVNGQLYRRYYDGTNWQAKEKIGRGTYPNFKLGVNDDRIEWVYTTCNGSPFDVAYSSIPFVRNSPPLAVDQNLSTSEDTPLNITLTGSDANGDSLTYSVVSGPSHGSLTGSPPALIYTPSSHYVGQDSFTFRAFDGKVYSEPATVSITISPLYIHVGDLDARANPLPSLWNAQVFVTVHDSAHNPVAGATVNGLWSYGAVETTSCTTGLDGICSMSKSNLPNAISSVTFNVYSLSQPNRIYNSSDNHDPDGDSFDGTTIVINRPPVFLNYLPFVVSQ